MRKIERDKIKRERIVGGGGGAHQRRKEKKRKREFSREGRIERDRSASLQIYSRLCGTFWRCGRTVVAEGGKARRIPRERGSLLSRSSSRRRAFHPLCVYVYTRPESELQREDEGEGTNVDYTRGGRQVEADEGMRLSSRDRETATGRHV